MSGHTSKFININNNVISGYNNNIETSINLSVYSTNTAAIGLYYADTNLGFEFLPNPIDNGVLRYRYSNNSTTTIFSFNGPNLFLNLTNLNSNSFSIIKSGSSIPGINMLIDPVNYGGLLTVNAQTGVPRFQVSIDNSQQANLTFFSDDRHTKGTIISNSTITTRNILGSDLDIKNKIVLHASGDVTISSYLNMGIDGNLYWNGTALNTGGGGGGGSNIVVSSFNYLYASTLKTNGIVLRGNNVLTTANLIADSNMNLYWNGQQILTGAQTGPEILTSTVSKFASFVEMNTFTAVTSTLQGVYNAPSIPPKWVIVGTNSNFQAAYIFTSFDEQITYSPPQSNGAFSGGGSRIYANPNNGQIIAVGIDTLNSSNTIQTTTDGINWSFIKTPHTFVSYAYTVYYAKNIWLIGGSAIYPIIYSTNGVDFYPATLAQPPLQNSAYGFSYNGTVFVAALNVTFGLYTTSLLWSMDGINWNNAISGGFSQNAKAVANKTNMWVACGISGNPGFSSNIQTSTDGKNWTPIPYQQPNLFQYGNTICYANGLWHIGGSGLNALNTILVSTDGLNWRIQTSGTISEVKSIKFVDQVWYAVGTKDTTNPIGALISTDGYNWSLPTEDAFSNGNSFYNKNFNDIFYLDTVLIGQGTINTAVSTSIYVTATVYSDTANTSNLLAKNATLQNTTISTLTATNIISPNYLQVQNVQF